MDRFGKIPAKINPKSNIICQRCWSPWNTSIPYMFSVQKSIPGLGGMELPLWMKPGTPIWQPSGTILSLVIYISYIHIKLKQPFFKECDTFNLSLLLYFTCSCVLTKWNIAEILLVKNSQKVRTFPFSLYKTLNVFGWVLQI